MSGRDGEHLMEVTGPSARSLDILARALHVKNAELQPTLEAIVSTAVRMLNPALDAGLTVFSHGEFTPQAAPVHLPDRGHRPRRTLAAVQRGSRATERAQHALRAAPAQTRDPNINK
jgi:hypothetical protein